MAPDGSDRTVIYRSKQGLLSSPAWSPDGSQVAFVEYRFPQSAPDWISDIYIIDRDGDDLSRVTETSDVSEDELDWSSRDMFVFRASQDRYDSQAYELFTMKPDGRELRQLTDNDVSDSQPDWAPDGDRLTFVRGDDKPVPNWKPPDRTGQIWTMDASGTPAAGIASGHSPTWAPDGTAIAFASEAGDAIHAVAPDGGPTTVIGRPVKKGSISELDWQPR